MVSNLSISTNYTSSLHLNLWIDKNAANSVLCKDMSNLKIKSIPNKMQLKDKLFHRTKLNSAERPYTGTKISLLYNDNLKQADKTPKPGKILRVHQLEPSDEMNSSSVLHNKTVYERILQDPSYMRPKTSTSMLIPHTRPKSKRALIDLSIVVWWQLLS